MLATWSNVMDLKILAHVNGVNVAYHLIRYATLAASHSDSNTIHYYNGLSSLANTDTRVAVHRKPLPFRHITLL
jgi:hypothetical protein